MAHLPFLKGLGSGRRAKTHATYTLPAHKSFFMGYLPMSEGPLDEPYYVPEVRQLWRLHEGRPRPLESIGILLDGINVLDAYKRMGFRVVGTGGVGWFTNPELSDLFEEFRFYGPEMTASVFDPRRPNDFSLNNVDSIFRMLKGSSRYFLFINSSETHVPYDFGEGLFSDEIRRIMNDAAPIWGCKKGNASKTQITADELLHLQRAQLSALEAVDAKLENLIDKLPKPLLLIVCGDHGECFGEDMLWGHGYPALAVMEVPLLITLID